MSILDLPSVNASLNGLSAVFLAAGFTFIKYHNRTAHRNCMVAALIASVLFLASYLTYHGYLACVLRRGPTRFLEPQWFRPVYLIILLTHTVLAMVIVPLILVTLWHAKNGHFESHRKIARWTWPLWMYVSVTGVAVYLLLYRIFPQG